MKNFKGLYKCAEGAVINTEDFMNSGTSSVVNWPGDRKRKGFKQSRTARRNTPCNGSRCYKPNTH